MTLLSAAQSANAPVPINVAGLSPKDSGTESSASSEATETTIAQPFVSVYDHALPFAFVHALAQATFGMHTAAMIAASRSIILFAFIFISFRFSRLFPSAKVATGATFPDFGFGAGNETPPPMHRERCVRMTLKDTPKEAKLHGRQCPFRCVLWEIVSHAFSRRLPNAAAATILRRPPTREI